MARSNQIAALLMAAALAPAAGAQELRVGVINTTTTGFSVLGIEMERGWKLGIEELGWKKDGDKLGGVPTHIFYGDDQIRPDVGLREVEKMLKTHKTQVIVGIIGSNVMMGVAKAIFDSNVSLIGTNAGPAPIAGELCSPFFVSTAFMNDQNAEATGELVNRDGIQSVYLVAPNYQAGKDNIAGFQRTYKGQVAGQSLVKLGETDFQAEFSLIRAKAPKAVFVFAPGAMTVAFMRQWEASGLAKDIKLYTLYMLDGTTLPALGATAIGHVYTNHYNPTLDNPRNQAFVKAFAARHNKVPPFYAMDPHARPAVGARRSQIQRQRLPASALLEAGGGGRARRQAPGKGHRQGDGETGFVLGEMPTRQPDRIEIGATPPAYPSTPGRPSPAARLTEILPFCGS